MEDLLYKIKNIHTCILNFLESDDNTEEYFQNFKENLSNEIIHQYFKLFLRLICQVSNEHYRGIYFIQKTEFILVFLRNEILKRYSNSTIFNIFKKNQRILLFLIEEGLLSIDQNIKSQIQYPEYFFLKEPPNDYEVKRKIGENDDHICILIQKDLIFEFIAFVNKNDYSLNSSISPSNYETHPLLLIEQKIKIRLSLIKYAAFFGSIQILKYLYHNKAKITPSIWKYAIHSNNIELIHFIEEIKIKPRNYLQIFIESIKCHHNSISNYIKKTYFGNGNECIKNSFPKILKFFNFQFIDIHFFSENVFDLLCKYDYFPFIKELIKTKCFNTSFLFRFHDFCNYNNIECEDKMSSENASQSRIQSIVYSQNNNSQTQQSLNQSNDSSMISSQNNNSQAQQSLNQSNDSSMISSHNDNSQAQQSLNQSNDSSMISSYNNNSQTHQSLNQSNYSSNVLSSSSIPYSYQLSNQSLNNGFSMYKHKIIYKLCKTNLTSDSIVTSIEKISYKFSTHFIILLPNDKNLLYLQRRYSYYYVLDLENKDINLIINDFTKGIISCGERRRLLLFASYTFFKDNDLFKCQWPNDTFIVLYHKDQIKSISDLAKYSNVLVYLSNKIKNSILNDENSINPLKEVLKFKQIEPAIDYSFFKQEKLRWIHLTYFLRSYDIDTFARCPNCGAVLFPGEKVFSCCRGFPQIKEAIDIGSPPPEILNIFMKYKDSVPNYARIINLHLRPVIQNAKIYSPNSGYSTIFVNGLPYAYDGCRQFLSSVYAIFSGNEEVIASYAFNNYFLQENEINDIISIILRSVNPFLLNYCRSTIEKLGGDKAYFRLLDENSKLRQIDKEAPLNIALVNADLNFQNRAQPAVELSKDLREKFKYNSHTISPSSNLYDKLLFPFIFINGKGGSGYTDEEAESISSQNNVDLLDGSDDDNNEDNSQVKDISQKYIKNSANDKLPITTFIRLTVKALLMQNYDHWINMLGTLREEWLVSQFGRIVYFQTEFQIRRQQLMANKSAISNGSAFTNENLEDGIKYTVQRTIQSSSAYWNEVENNGFLLSAKFGAPCFFLTLTTNKDWDEFKDIKEPNPFHNGAALSRVFKIRFHRLLQYLRSSELFGKIHAIIWRIEYQQRGLPHTHILIWSDYDTSDIERLDSLINSRHLIDDPNIENYDIVSETNHLIDHLQKHVCSPRCRKNAKSLCDFGYPMPISNKSAIVNNQYMWKRSSSDVNVVPHNLKLMRIWGAHHNIEVVTSQKPIGYVLKYISKNSDIAKVEINQYRKNVRYINQPVAKNDKLRYCVATRVACAPECFHEIEGSWKYHINPKCYTIHLHLPGENYIHFNFGDTLDDIGKKSSLSQLERYFARPNDPSFDDVLLTDYYSFYLVSNSLKDYQFLDEGDPKFMVKHRSPDNIANYGIHPYTPIHMELFCLRILLINFSARSFDDLLQFNGNTYTSFADVAQSRGLINNKREFNDCMDEAIKCNYPGLKIRWLFCNLIRSGANCSELYNEYHDVLIEDFENEKDLKFELASMLNRMKIKRQPFFDDIVVFNSYPFAQKQELSSSLSENQNRVLSEIINFIDNTNCSNLCFLQGSAGTGKTFLIKTLINILEHNERKCLISATTGIAASQYKGASTVHSLFHLTIDQDKKKGRFTSNIEKNTFAEQLLQQADLIIIDECSMLTKKVIGDCDMTLRYAMVESSDEGIPVQTPEKMQPFGGKKFFL